ncbi:hypothetical protein LIER_20507 [Lithospermum erythrorhizon]|uniref:Integrase catalytic domain-containing protein n=1 Tax=Lithospermum erythrorhizon TaxID=34254 RepID=A0AAV3QSE0_LITER
MYNEELYKKSWDGPLLRCVAQEDIPKIIAEIHQGWCGSHIGGRSLAVKITRIRYFWPTLVKDAMNFVKRCDVCQRMGSIQHQPTTCMTPILNPIPFAMRGIDLVRKLSKVKGSLEYVVVVVDYSSKGVEAAPLKKTGSDNIAKFLWKHVITRFGVPNILLSNNGPQFGSEELARFCEKYNIEHRFSPVYYPQSNGQTPFSLVYGSEALFPVEARLPTYRLPGFSEEENEQRMREQLNFVDELRDRALYKMKKYKHLMARTYNRRVKNRQFKVGDLVLRLYSITHPRDKDKLSPKWEGPYRISRMIGPGTYELERLNGDMISRIWHASNLVKYYV